MGTTIRPEISGKNLYWIDRHRYYELKHFCMQYPLWKASYKQLDGFNGTSPSMIRALAVRSDKSPTEACAEARIFYGDRIRMVEKAAEEADPVIGRFLLIGVTEGLSYPHLKARMDIPCGKDTYYDVYRKFFYLLSETRK